MDYCDECGGLIAPQKNEGETSFKCRNCGKPYTKTEEGELRITEQNKDEKKSIDIEAEDDSLPTTDEDCEECGNDTAYWWMLQTRAADEPETRFFKCTECDHTWREYD